MTTADDPGNMKAMDSYRQMLEGPCAYVGDRWFGRDSDATEREAYLKAFNARQDRNWRRRMRRRGLQAAAREAERLARLPPWRQTAITGRTATQTMRDGTFVPVNYRQVYGMPEIGPRGLEYDYLVSGLLLTAREGGKAIGRRLARALAGARQRKPHPVVASDEWSARMRIERRKICRRSTSAPCPTATDIRVAWHFAKGSPEGRLRLGQLLMDLECYVQNDLKIHWINKRPKIVARLPGIRGWIRLQCPELVPKYKTLMRFKSLAMRVRQESGEQDPFSPRGNASRNITVTIQVQPRDKGLATARVQRFAWEFGARRTDADGRPFLTNENYARAIRDPAHPPRMDHGPADIVLNVTPGSTIENYARAPA